MPSGKEQDAVSLLKKDHEEVKGLFEQFEQTEDEDEKERIADEVDLALRVHSMVEEEILYPAMRDVDSEIVAESFEEHGVVEELLDELATMELGDEQFSAKFKVMSENVKHHIEEEESQMFPQVSKLPNYGEIGPRLSERKMELTEQLQDMGDPLDRASDGGLPGTVKASEKSEMVLAGAVEKASEAPKAPRKNAAKGRRSRRAKATSGRSRK